MPYPILRSLLFAVDPETAHALTLRALAVLPAGRPVDDDPVLATRVGSLALGNPVGLAAGYDKDAVALPGLARLGFGWLEAGTLTLRAQPGNPRPRMIRLAADEGVINRLGFNNGGLDAALVRIRAMRTRLRVPIGINVGVNKDADDRIGDFARAVAAASTVGDWVTVNVSSPNTPGLRGLQGAEELDVLLPAVVAARGARTTPLFLKVAPDLDEAQVEAVGDAARRHAIDALIVSNTTLARPATLRSTAAGETGGLSGRPLFERSTAVLAGFARATGGRVPLIGVGGIASGADAYAKIRNGACAVQLYTMLAYRGPGLVAAIKRELAALLRRDGWDSVAQAVGVDVR